MLVLVILIGASLSVAAGFLIAFLWSVKKNQYEDTVTPAHRILMDDPR
jgi:cbb3-type cytochrome oxidase maturation protein